MQTPQVGLQETILGRSATQVRRLSFRSRKRSEQKGQAEATPASPQVEQESETDFDRFRAPRLSQVEGKADRFSSRDAMDEPGNGLGPVEQKSRAAATFDKVLLALEIAAALVVAWLAFQYVYTLYFDTAPRRVTPGTLSSATPSAIRTATPKARLTPTHFVEVLPPMTGGPGEEPGTATNGGVEQGSTAKATTTPETVRPTPTATIDPALILPNRLRIPVMFLDSPVHEVMVNMGQWEVAPMDIGHHEGTANPGEVGNVVLAGHRDINSALFRELDRLKPGDEVFVSNSIGEYKYIVRDSYVVSPDHTEVMDPTPDKRVTLITCTPIGIATQRLIVIATLDEPDTNGGQ